MSDAGDIQRDLELSATETDAATAAAREIQKNIHTQMPGIIRSYDPATQTATVQPAIQRVWIEDGGVDLPQCLDVPVYFPRGGKFALTFPVAPGDECSLNFSERAIDFWFENGGVQLPSEYRLHDLSDAFAFVGFSSKPNAIKDVATDAAELRTLDGKTRIRVEDGMVTAGDLADAVAAVRADVINEILGIISGHTHVVAGTSATGGPVTGEAAPSEELSSLPDPSAKNVKVS
jgi:hypothetical protein